eukprot:m.528143 g.528143  ORF g.528143 m.528143 type:complete len:404 (-) comp22015_c0_seq18:989-2200(-)
MSNANTMHGTYTLIIVAAFSLLLGYLIGSSGSTQSINRGGFNTMTVVKPKEPPMHKVEGAEQSDGWNQATAVASIDSVGDLRFLHSHARRWPCCILPSQSGAPPGCNHVKPCFEDRALEIAGSTAVEYLGPQREENLELSLADCWANRTALNARSAKSCWFRKNNNVVLANPRGVVTAGVGGAAKVFGKDIGLGNQLFGAAGLIANALRLDRIPTVGCSSCFVHSFFRKMHCIEHTEFTPAETARIRKFGDGGYLMTSAAQEDLQTQSHADRSLIVDFSLFFQSAVGIQDYAPAVCSTLQPSAGLQQQVEAYVDAVMSPLHGQMTPEYRTVALHVRRGTRLHTACHNFSLSIVASGINLPVHVVQWLVQSMYSCHSQFCRCIYNASRIMCTIYSPVSAILTDG